MDERLRRLLGPGRPELTCEECFAELPRYVELELEGKEHDSGSDSLDARMQAHLEGCAACGEEHAVLRELALETRE